MDICAFLMGNPRSNCLTLNIGSPSSVPIHFQRYLGWFWGRKASLTKGESRGSGFGNRRFVYLHSDSWFLYKPGWGLVCTQSIYLSNYHIFGFQIPPSFFWLWTEC